MTESTKSHDKNYYDLLGLKINSSFEDIGSAYRKLAIKWHPDKHKNNKEIAIKKFCEITTAYKTLSDPVSRKLYDSTGTMNLGKSIDPYDIFKEVFEEDDTIPNIVVYIEADIEQLYTGFTEAITFTRYSKCDTCDSTGTVDRKQHDCSKCKGKGILLESIKGGKIGYMINERKCDFCEGNGIELNIKLCKDCNGSKYIQETIECDVDVPSGAYTNYFIKLENEGNFIPKEDRKTKQNRSDVLAVIKEKIESPNKYKRGVFINEINRINMADIMMTKNISFADAIGGIKQEITFLGGETIVIDIEDLIQNGDMYVLEGCGMALVPEELTNNVNVLRGDLFIQFKIDKPEISQGQRRKIWQILTGKSYIEDCDYDECDDIIKQPITIDQYIYNYKTKKSDNEISDNERSDNERSDNKRSDNERSDNQKSDNQKSDDERSDNENSDNEKLYIKPMTYKTITTRDKIEIVNSGKPTNIAKRAIKPKLFRKNR